MPTYFGGKKGDHGPAEKVGQKLGRRDRPPIQQCLRKGDEIVVQIIKEGIGTKGPTLSTYLSIPGRVLVMMPGMAKMGVSKKIEDETERTRLRKILDGLTPPKDCGFIIRTAGIGKSKLEIEKDLKYLARLWDQLKKQIEKDKPPVELYTEGDLITRTVRDVFTSDVDSIIVDDKETAKKIKDFIKLAMPRTKNKVELYEEQLPLFHKYELEEVVESMYSRRVPLPSGGSLIIDQTEAVVAIDVNSGKFREHSDAEMTAFKTDMEAADEIPRQLRLRDMGGVIICDFIDLRFERHRRELEERLFENLKKDRAKTRMLRMSQFGIVEMTRQRMRPSLRKAIYHDCESCGGQGMVKTPESMALDVMRKIRIGLNDAAVVRLTLTVNPDVALFLQNRKRYEIAKLEQDIEKRVSIATDADMSMDAMKFELYDARDGYIYIAELGMELPATHQHNQRRDHPQGERGRGRRDDRRNEQSKPKHDKREDEAVDAEELFSEEPAAPAPKAAGRGRGKAAALKAAEAEAGDAVEQTGNDDEASVVDVDEGGDELPGNAPGGFFDPSENRDRRPGGNNRDRNRGRDRGRGGDRGGDRNRDNRGPDNRGPDNRNRDDSNRGDRPRRDRYERPADAPPATPRPVDDERPENAEAGEAEEFEGDDIDGQQENQGLEGRDQDGGDQESSGDLFDNAPAGQGGDNANGPRGEGNGEDGQPREGGRRRRRRRGRRGRGRNGEGNPEGGPPQGDRPEGEQAQAGPDGERPRDNRQQDNRPQGDRQQGDRRPNDRQQGDRNQGDRNQGGRQQGDRQQGDRQQGNGQQVRHDDPRRRQPGDFRGGQQGYRGNDRGRGQGGRQGGGGPPGSRRGSSPADLSHLAREASRQDGGHTGGVDPAEDEHATPGNDINFVPKPRELPRLDRRGRPLRGKGRGNAAPRRAAPIEGLPNDEELDREAAALEAQLAKAREAELTPPTDHQMHAQPAAAETPPARPARAPRTPKVIKSSTKPIKRANVAKTGSSDKHLVDDEPASGEDVKPPSSFVDLDALPDYDDD